MMNGEQQAQNDGNGKDKNSQHSPPMDDVSDQSRSRSWTPFSSFSADNDNRNFDRLVSSGPFVVGVKGIGGDETQSAEDGVQWLVIPVEEKKMEKVHQMVDYVRGQLKLSEKEYSAKVMCHVERIKKLAKVGLELKLDRTFRYEITFVANPQQPTQEENVETDGLELELTELREENGQLKQSLEQTEEKLATKEAMLVDCQNHLKESREQCETKEKMFGQLVKALEQGEKQLKSKELKLDELGQSMEQLEKEKGEMANQIDELTNSLKQKGTELGQITAMAQELKGKIERMELEVKLPEESKNSLLLFAVKKGNVERVRELLLAGANANAVDEDDPSGWSDVVKYAKDGQMYNHNCGYSYAKFMAEVKAANGDCGGWPALTIAAKDGNDQIVRMLLEKGALVNKRGGPSKYTALGYATSGGRTNTATATANVLREFGAI